MYCEEGKKREKGSTRLVNKSGHLESLFCSFFSKNTEREKKTRFFLESAFLITHIEMSSKAEGTKKRKVESEDESSRKSSRETKEITRFQEEQAVSEKSETMEKIRTASAAIKVSPTRQPLPTRDSITNELHFKDYPSFRPNLTPEEVLRLGSFGGTYFRPIHSSVTGLDYGDEFWKELPGLS